MENNKRRQTRSGGSAKKSKYAAKYSAKKTNRHGAVAVICIAAAILLIAVAIVVGLVLRDFAKSSLRVPENVSAAGIDISGMTQDEAEEALRLAAQNSYSQKSMVIQILDDTYELTPLDTGAALDASAVAKAAVMLPSGGSQVMDILPYLTLNESAIEAVVERLESEYNTEFIQSAYALEDDPETPSGQVLILTVGAPGFGLDAAQLYDQIMAAYNNNSFYVEAEYTAQTPKPLDLDAIYLECYAAPANAVMDMQTFEVTKEVQGSSFDLETAKEALANAQYGDVIEIPIDTIVPEVTAESLQSLLFRDTLFSYGTSHTSDENRNTNLRLACQAVDGLVLQPGEIFSFNQALGQRTEEKGYKAAASYADGEVVDTIGGGICQVASTIYYCALMSDLEIIDRDCHMFAPSYLPYGMDATINWGTIDFQFRNNTEYPLRIEADVSGGKVNVSLVGTDTKDYYVKMEYEITETDTPDTIYQEMAPDNSKGYQDGDVITYPITGYLVETYRCKYDKETDTLISRDFEDSSRYMSRDKVVCKIVDNSQSEAPPEEPPEILNGGGVSEDPGD